MALPIIAWASMTTLALGAMAAGAWLLSNSFDSLGTLAANVASVRENTRRYAVQVAQLEARYRDCIEQGKTPTECSALFPVPDAPQEVLPAPADRSLPWGWVIGGALATLLVIGGVAYAARKYGRTPRALPSGTAGGYGMEVR